MGLNTSIYRELRVKMEDAGFQFEIEQHPHHQKRKENELKFIHPALIKRFEEDGMKTSAKKFYIKPLSDDEDCEIGLVTGTTSPLYNTDLFPQSNAVDTFKNYPAWTNREQDKALDKVLSAIKIYLRRTTPPVVRPRGTFLFTWNPNKWNWTEPSDSGNLQSTIEKLNTSGTALLRWSCYSHKSIRVGDRAFLAALAAGEHRKGIIGSGIVVSTPEYKDDWSGEDKGAWYVWIDFDALLNPYSEEVLTFDRLKSPNLSKQQWTPQSSGISIKKEVVEELEKVWFEFLSESQTPINQVGNSNERHQTFLEGEAIQVFQTRYERNLYARKECLAHHGYRCCVCEFDFEKKYGPIGYGFIHVHHITPVSKRKAKYEVDPVRDLRPVCPNCHAMLHRTNPPYTIEELKDLMR